MRCPSCGREGSQNGASCSTCSAGLATATEDVLDPKGSLVPAIGFIGRHREIASLKAALEGAISGEGRVVMLVGEPGVGKTRTARELASHAEARGTQVLWGWCYEEAGAPPFWPWIQPLRSYVQHQDPAQLRSYMGAGAAAIAEIIPQVRDKLPDLQSPPALEPEQARFRLFDSIATFLKNAARRQPLVLVLDDLHWADQSSLLLLEFIAQELQTIPLLIIGTYRDLTVSRQHTLSQTLGSLLKTSGFSRLHLQGFSQTEVAQLLEITPGWDSAPQTIAAIYQRTEGNPLFVSEILRGLNQKLLADGSGHLTAIPEGVKEAIGRRLSRLSEHCNRALTTASIIGREFELQLLRALVEKASEDQVLEIVEEALAARIIEEAPGSPTAYQFVHALIQDTLAGQLSAARRVRWHARIGEAMEKLYAPELEAHAAELAFHFYEAGTLISEAKLVRFCTLAGEQALAAYAWEEALQHFQRGLEAMGSNLKGTEPARDADEAALLFGVARAKSATLQTEQLVDAFNILRRAFDYYVEAGEVALAVEAAEFPIGIPTGRFRGEDGQILARALSLVRADSHEAGRLLSRYGGYLGLAETDYEGAQQALGQAVSIARRERDVLLEVQTLAYAADVSGQHLHWQESVDIALRAIELATGKETTYAEVLTRFWASVSLLHMGDPNAARPHALTLRDMAERRGTARYLVILSLVPIITLSYLQGEWRASREHSDRALEMSPLHPQHLALRVLLEYESGQSIQGKVYLERLLEQRQLSRPSFNNYSSGRLPMFIAEVNRITGSCDHWETAESDADAILSARFVIPVAGMYARAGLALLAAQRGDQAAAEEHYDYFLSHRGTMIWILASADRLLGLLAQTAGNLEQAAAHFQDALAFCRKAGYRPELAWTCHDYAETLLRRNAPGGRSQAASLLEESLSIARELGMRPLMERVLALQEQVQHRRWDSRIAPAYPDGLTEREVEVLRLVAAGRTDREIGEELFISVRTVTTHVSNIRNKIGAANRTEAATYANRHGLI